MESRRTEPRRLRFSDVPTTALKAAVYGYGLWGTAGVLMGAISIFNLIVKTYALGLRPMIADIVTAYRWTFHIVILDPLWKALHVSVPAWFNDVVVVWCAGAAVAYRTVSAVLRTGASSPAALGEWEHRLRRLGKRASSALVGVLSLLFWPVLWVRFAYSKPLSFLRAGLFFRWPEYRLSYRRMWLLQLTTIGVLVVLLLVTSAGLPPPAG